MSDVEVLRELLRKLDEVCRQAEELSKQLRQTMSDRARQEQQLLSRGRPASAARPPRRKSRR